MRTIRRYLLLEILGPFSLGLFVITILFIIQKIILITEWAVNRGVGAPDMARMIFFFLPLLLLIVIPITSLFSILLAMGRLSSDNEVVALKASGVSLYRLMPPALAFSIFTMCLCLYASLELMPRANHAARVLRYRIIKTKSEQGLQVRTFINFIPRVFIYVRDKDAGGLKGVILSQEEYEKKKERGNTIVKVTRRFMAFADRVQMDNDPVTLTNTMIMYDGQVLLQDLTNNTFHEGRFKRARVRLEWNEDELTSHDERLEMSGLDLVTRIDFLEKSLTAGHEMKDGERRKAAKELNELKVMLHERLVFPVGCLFLCFWGVPLGISPPRTGRARSLIMGVILSLIFYYLIIFGKAMALKGFIDPAAGMWTPNALVVVTGLYFLRQRAQEKPVILLTALENELYYRLDQARAWWLKRRGAGDDHT